MANLTQHLNVVGTEQSGVHPQMGSYIVVLKQVGEGRVLHSVLPPGQRPPEPKLLARMFKANDDLVSIPVTANSSLRHEFTSSVEHVLPGHSFDADYVLSFAVASPEKVATRWLEDPIRRIEQEIRRVLDPPARAIEWNKLRDNVLADGAARLCRDQVQNHIDDLRSFAEEYGINIANIRLSLRLSRTDARPDVEVAELGRQQISIQVGATRRRSEMDAEYDLRKHEALQKSELRDIERPEELTDAGYANAIKALGNVADNIHHGEDLTRTARDIAAMMNPRGAVGPALVAREKLALVSGSGPDNKVVLGLEELVTLVDGLDGEDARKRELLSALLHVIAEAWRAKDADPEAVKKYEGSAETILSEWSGLNNTQFTSLSKFASFTALREHLR